MTRQSEFKKKYDPDMGKYTRKHIYGKGILDSVKSFFGKKPSNKKVTFAVTPPPKPSPADVTKTTGDEIVKLLSGENPKTSRKKNTRQEINNNVLKILSGSGRKNNIMYEIK